MPLYGSHDSSRKIKEQLEWSNDVKGTVWTYIVSEKIHKQSELLGQLGHVGERDLLLKYIDEITFNDETNREGHAAKVYFNALFGKSFTRSDGVPTNAALNYGYSLILSVVNREVAANGYLTQLGLFHDNVFNHFNLSCDLMEPFRVLVDKFVEAAHFEKFETQEKHKLLELLQQSVYINNSSQIFTNAIKTYVKSVFDALGEADPSLIFFYSL